MKAIISDSIQQVGPKVGVFVITAELNVDNHKEQHRVLTDSFKALLESHGFNVEVKSGEGK